MLESICDKQTLSLKMVLDETYKLIEKEKGFGGVLESGEKKKVDATATSDHPEQPPPQILNVLQGPEELELL